jgi:hypothetical protein
MKPRVFVEVLPGKKKIHFNYPKDKQIAATIWKELETPLIKCKIDLFGFIKVNGIDLEVLMKGMRAAKEKILTHPFLSPDEKALLNNIWVPDSKTRPEAINTKLARNLRPVVNFLINEHGLFEDEATALVLEIVKGYFPGAAQLQKIKLPAFQRAIRKI